VEIAKHKKVLKVRGKGQGHR